MNARFSKPLIALLLAPVVGALLLVLGIALFGWNWARAPLQQLVEAKTGRALVIAGDLDLQWNWPLVRVRAQTVSFANPAWATEPQMLVTEAADVAIDLSALWGHRLVLPDVRLTRPVLMLQAAADGRKTWLLDRLQKDDTTPLAIGRLTLDHGQLGYDDKQDNTHFRLKVDTSDAHTGALVFKAQGTYQGLPLAASGNSASVLALRDATVPFPLNMDATIGPTTLHAKGTLTGLLGLTALDMQVALRGGSLAQLYGLVGLGLPETHAYAMSGRLVHDHDVWRFEKFNGTVGHSDVAGTLQAQLVGGRPMLKGAVVSQVMDLDDLAPVIGAHMQAPDRTTAAQAAPPAEPKQVLPDVPFKADRWQYFNADVTLQAMRIQRAKALPLDQLKVHVQLQDAVLTLNPLDFVAAGGHLTAHIVLDARQSEIKSTATIQVRKLLLPELFPTLDLAKTSVGQLDGAFTLKGHGNSVKHMLASSDGAVHLDMGEGKISRLMMEQVGLHLLEILQLRIGGDSTIVLRCAVADFSVEHGTLKTRQLLLDTDVNTVVGSGSIDLGAETLDLTLVPRTRTTSLVALRSPIYLRGTLGAPKLELDTGKIMARGAGALALGLINPVLALIPLIESGPGISSKCAGAHPASRHD